MDSATSVANLERRFGIPRLATVIAGHGGLPKVQISSATASGEIYLHGAHVTSWRPTGAEEVLFLSPRSCWLDGKAIRGGVPICFPWFGDKNDDPAAPAHGFVRTRAWQLEAIERDGDAVTVAMFIASDPSTRLWWPGDFRLHFRATFGAKLTLVLELHNVGQAPLRFEEALHCYFAVGDVRSAGVFGLDSVHYLDKTDSYRNKVQNGDVRLTSETDRVYVDTQGPVVLHDPVMRRSIQVAKENSLTTVIWNPWEEKATAMADLGSDAWTQMLCIETSNVLASAVELAPGQSHRMCARVTVNPPGLFGTSGQ